MKLPDLRVRIRLDQDKKTLTISDNGIGLSQQEAIEHLGTIAKSGTKRTLRRNSTGDQKADAQLIGQFGVGFYSGFISWRIKLLWNHAVQDWLQMKPCVGAARVLVSLMSSKFTKQNGVPI